MQENSTQNQMIRSIYQELDTCEDITFKKELIQQPNLASEYRELKKSVSLLTNNEYAPKNSTIEAILQKSRRRAKELV